MIFFLAEIPRGEPPGTGGGGRMPPLPGRHPNNRP